MKNTKKEVAKMIIALGGVPQYSGKKKTMYGDGISPKQEMDLCKVTTIDVRSKRYS